MIEMAGKRVSLLTIALTFLTGAAISAAATIGINPPAPSLTRDRVATLPAAQRGAWLEYLDRSQAQRQADKEALQLELKTAGMKTPTEPQHSFGARNIPLEKEPSWYSSAEARHIADVILSFQTPAGGWGKNMEMSKEPRHPGEAFTPNNLSQFLTPGDFDTPLEPEWNYVGTIDNDATTTQINFLAKVIAAEGPGEGAAYRTAFSRGMNYLFAAQFPNGGWPQVWPLEGAYHDAITYNDNAVSQVLELMQKIAEGRDEFAFVAKDMRARAAESFTRGIHCILATQIISNGKTSVWGQQVDPLTLKPVSGRNFEPNVQSASESANLLLLLINALPHPSAEEQRSIRVAAAWFKKTAIYGQSWERTAEGRELVAQPGAGPIWARYYQIDTDRPVFGDRDKSIHNQVSDLSRERRNGYAWYSAEPQHALDRFEKWNAEHPDSHERISSQDGK
jgi:PelA/Pel-15E family pectate lyase